MRKTKKKNAHTRDGRSERKTAASDQMMTRAKKKCQKEGGEAGGEPAGANSLLRKCTLEPQRSSSSLSPRRATEKSVGAPPAKRKKITPIDTKSICQSEQAQWIV